MTFVRGKNIEVLFLDRRNRRSADGTSVVLRSAALTALYRRKSLGEASQLLRAGLRRAGFH
jgi:hypothetical protein